MAEPDMQVELAELKEQLTAFKVDVSDKFAKLETEVRVVKHDFANIRDMMNGAVHRMDKMEERLIAKFDALAEKIATVNVQQGKGAGFIAGVMAAAGVTGTLLMFIAKLLFGGHS